MNDWFCQSRRKQHYLNIVWFTFLGYRLGKGAF